MKRQLIFAIVLCVQAFVMGMDRQMLTATKEQNMKKPIDALFRLDSKKRVTSRNIKGTSYHFFDDEKNEFKDDIFSCLKLTEEDMQAVKGAFSLLDEKKSPQVEFSLFDRPVKCKLVVDDVESPTIYLLKFEREESPLISL